MTRECFTNLVIQVLVSPFFLTFLNKPGYCVLCLSAFRTTVTSGQFLCLCMPLMTTFVATSKTLVFRIDVFADYCYINPAAINPSLYLIKTDYPPFRISTVIALPAADTSHKCISPWIPYVSTDVTSTLATSKTICVYKFRYVDFIAMHRFHLIYEILLIVFLCHLSIILLLSIINIFILHFVFQFVRKSPAGITGLISSTALSRYSSSSEMNDTSAAVTLSVSDSRLCNSESISEMCSF